jgi:acetyl/propionyl-CoA carboxylase alpha subunit
MRIAGIPTSLAFHRSALFHQLFITGRYDTGFLAEWERRTREELPEGAVTAAALAAVLASRARSEHRPVALVDQPWARSAREDALR